MRSFLPGLNLRKFTWGSIHWKFFIYLKKEKNRPTWHLVIDRTYKYLNDNNEKISTWSHIHWRSFPPVIRGNPISTPFWIPSGAPLVQFRVHISLDFPALWCRRERRRAVLYFVSLSLFPIFPSSKSFFFFFFFKI